MIQVFAENFLDSAMSKVASSEAAGYPATNVFNIQRRRLTWRSGGYWLVEAGANTIEFTETAISLNLVATIAAGEYSTDAAFLAAIKAALEAAGLATYTVSRDVDTGKIKILSSLTAGATEFNIFWTSAPDFGDIIGFDTTVDLTGSNQYLADELRIHTEESFTFDLGIPSQPTGFMAVSDRNRPINITPNATVLLMGNPTNNFTAPAETFVITVRDFLLGYIDSDGIAKSSAQGYRYWKLKIVDNDNPDGYLELGAMALATHLVTARGCPTFPFESKPVDFSVRERSESGQKWVGKRPKSKIHALSWEGLTNDELASLEAFWEEVGCQIAFFVCFDPSSAFSSDGVFWTRLCSFESEPTQRLMSPGNWSYAWELMEEL